MAIRLGIRTHFYDHCVAHAYHEWRKLLGDDVFLLADETRAPVEADGARKLSWTEADAEALGLPMLPPKRVPWYNGDYHIYHMIPHMEENDFCFLVEHDVFLRVSDSSRLLALLKECSQFDFVAPRIGNRPSTWQWQHNLDALYDEDVKGALVMIVGFNRPTARYLLERRVALNERRLSRGSEQWPFVEAFIGTELCRAPNVRSADVEKMAGLTNRQIRTTPPFLLEDLLANAPPDVLYHPCLSRERFLAKIRVLFRTRRPDRRSWGALQPFVAAATEPEMDTLNLLARKHWGVASLREAFPAAMAASPAAVPARGHPTRPRTDGQGQPAANALDVGPMLALYMRMQREQMRPAVAPQNTRIQRRGSTRDTENLFFKLIETLRIDFACEVGAHDGAFSRRVRAAMPDTRVIAFEANPVIFDLHRRALEDAGVEFHRMCVADQSGTTQLKVPVRDDAPPQPGEDPEAGRGESPQHAWPGQDKAVTMGSTLEFGPANRFELFECETVTLDGFLTAHPFRRGALWVDVEGAASRVFEGAAQTLANCVAIYVELESRTKWMGQKSDADVYQFLFAHGFVPLVADLQKSWQYNVILLRRDMIKPAIQRTILEFLGEQQSRLQ